MQTGARGVLLFAGWCRVSLWRRNVLHAIARHRRPLERTPRPASPTEPVLAPASGVLHVVRVAEVATRAEQLSPVSVGTPHARPPAGALGAAQRLELLNAGWASAVAVRRARGEAAVAAFIDRAVVLDVRWERTGLRVGTLDFNLRQLTLQLTACNLFGTKPVRIHHRTADKFYWYASIWTFSKRFETQSVATYGNLRVP